MHVRAACRRCFSCFANTIKFDLSSKGSARQALETRRSLWQPDLLEAALPKHPPMPNLFAPGETTACCPAWRDEQAGHPFSGSRSHVADWCTMS